MISCLHSTEMAGSAAPAAIAAISDALLSALPGDIESRDLGCHLPLVWKGLPILGKEKFWSDGKIADDTLLRNWAGEQLTLL